MKTKFHHLAQRTGSGIEKASVSFAALARTLSAPFRFRVFPLGFGIASLLFVSVASPSLHAQDALTFGGYNSALETFDSNSSWDTSDSSSGGTLLISGASESFRLDVSAGFFTVPVAVGGDPSWGTFDIRNGGTVALGGTLIYNNLATASIGTLCLNGSAVFDASLLFSGSNSFSSNLTLGSGGILNGSGTISGGTLRRPNASGSLATGGGIGVLSSQNTALSPPLTVIGPNSLSTTLAGGSAYENFPSFTPSSELATTVKFRDGIAGSGGSGDDGGNRTVYVSFADHGAEPLASDILTLTGTAGNGFADTLAIEVTYDETTAFSLFGRESAVRLGWLNTATGEWDLATDGNTGAGIFAGFYAMSYADFLAAHGGAFDPSAMLGAYGLDTSANSVWAVINHNSEFGAIQAVPEPSAWVLLLSGAAMVFALRRRGKVESLQHRQKRSMKKLSSL